jgi:hypothetical protein
LNSQKIQPHKTNFIYERKTRRAKTEALPFRQNAEGNYTANELYMRLKYHNPWITDPKWSSEMAKIDKILEFLEQFPVEDIKMMGLNACQLNFDRPLSRQDIKDIATELNATFLPDENDDHLDIAIFDLRDYAVDRVSYKKSSAMPSTVSYEERVEKLRVKEKEEMASHAEKERLHRQKLKEADAKTNSKLNPRETIARIAGEYSLDETNYDTARILFYYVVKELVAPDLPQPETPISDAFIKRLEDLSKIRFKQFLDLSGAG